MAISAPTFHMDIHAVQGAGCDLCGGSHSGVWCKPGPEVRSEPCSGGLLLERCSREGAFNGAILQRHHMAPWECEVSLRPPHRSTSILRVSPSALLRVAGWVTLSTYLVLVLGGKLLAATALAMFVGASLASVLADVTIDALVAMKSREKPELARHIQSLCSACYSIEGLSGYLLSVLAVCIFLVHSLLWVLWLCLESSSSPWASALPSRVCLVTFGALARWERR